MQAYGAAFARVYNARWGAFARRVAPLIQAYYAGTDLGTRERSLLDICCGPGHLAMAFLASGYRVTGVDLSPAMVAYASQNAAAYVDAGQARFLRADACRFALDERFGLVTATFDALNHLSDVDALASCLRQARDATLEGGSFVFDLNTRAGLQSWNSIHVDDTRDLLLVNRGVYDAAAGKAYTRLSGFVAVSENTYERFEETVYNTAFDLQAVRSLLLDSGWTAAHIAAIEDLSRTLDDPESEARVWFVASC